MTLHSNHRCKTHHWHLLQSIHAKGIDYMEKMALTFSIDSVLMWHRYLHNISLPINGTLACHFQKGCNLLLIQSFRVPLALNNFAYLMEKDNILEDIIRRTIYSACKWNTNNRYNGIGAKPPPQVDNLDVADCQLANMEEQCS